MKIAMRTLVRRRPLPSSMVFSFHSHPRCEVLRVLLMGQVQSLNQHKSGFFQMPATPCSRSDLGRYRVGELEYLPVLRFQR